ncbi:hypothetical protein DRH27_01680 [Candidatus Falkowbacteria bacterium]|nr:MAG: hypothetical protein DRH27_01680 [Candidatus Falkowbacteria bacterium]
MNKIKISAILIILAIIFFPLKIALADIILQGEENAIQTASLFLIPEKSSFLNPDYITLNLIVSPENAEINAVSAYLSFDTSKLQLVSTNKNNSFCSFFVSENINNDLGRYDLTCATLGNSASTTSEVISLTFQKLETGWTKLNILDNSQVLAHNGLGTNILGSSEIHNILLVK